MTQKEILQFITDNQGDRILDYFGKCYDKIKELNKRSDQLTIYAIIVVVVYYVSKHSKIDTFQLGSFSMSDLSFFQKVSAPIFAYIFLEWTVLAYHRSDLLKKIKFMSLALYNLKIEVKDLDNNHFNDYIRYILPFNLLMDLPLAFKSNEKSNAWGLLFLPILIILILPFWALYVMIKNSFQDFPSDLLAIISNIVTIYLIVLICSFYYKKSKKQQKVALEDNQQQL